VGGQEEMREVPGPDIGRGKGEGIRSGEVSQFYELKLPAKVVVQAC